MTERSISELRARHPNHVGVRGATSAFHEGPIARAELASLMTRVSACEDLLNEGRACMLFGRGSQTRQEYRDLARIEGLSILWQGEFVPWWMLPLALIAASHGGLVRVMDRTRAAQAMLRLADLAMVELYSFRVDLLDEVLEHVRQHRWLADVGRVVGNDPDYFTVGVDGDSNESATGAFAWASYGAECPADLKSSVVATHSG
jgi:hypothetical protein